ncbi:MAG: Cellulase [Bacteroidetes bacterium]|nr:Cellulase [Bacteroidota bacterium]
MKHFLLITLSLVSILTFSSFTAPRNTSVAVHGNLKVTGTQLVDQQDQPVMLRGASFGWHNLWPRYYNKKAVSWLVKDWKCNVIRASMGVGLDDSYLENPDFALKCMTTVIDEAIKCGIYVIIDFHSHKIHTAEAKEFFTLMAVPSIRIISFWLVRHTGIRTCIWLQKIQSKDRIILCTPCISMQGHTKSGCATVPTKRLQREFPFSFLSVLEWKHRATELLPRASSEGNWADDVIKKWGLLGRDAIRKGNLNNVSNHLNHDPQIK